MRSTRLELWVDAGVALDLRSAEIRQCLSEPFVAEATATTKIDDLDLDVIVGQSARIAVHGVTIRNWTGIVAEAEVLHASRRDVSTVRLRIVAPLWLLSQRTGYRIFQYRSEIEIVLLMLKEWDIHPIVRLDADAYPRRKYRVQYGETDLAFVSRMLEEVGVSYWFEDKDDHTYMVIGDAPQTRPPGPSLAAVDPDGMVTGRPYATGLAREAAIRPGAIALRDTDLRIAAETDLGTQAVIVGGDPMEAELRFEIYQPGFMHRVMEGGGGTVADDRGMARSDQAFGDKMVRRRLEALRSGRDVVSFESNLVDLFAGEVVVLENVRPPDVPEVGPYLVIAAHTTLSANDIPRVACRAVPASAPWRPARVTPKPVAEGVESATVVGPPGKEIYTDESGRVRVSFHWDRESKYDAESSCFVPVSQPWAGKGYGGVNIPRVGQEVVVDFENGDPDRPFVTGRVYTAAHKVPYTLPMSSTESGWRSNSTNKKGGFNEVRMQDSGLGELLSFQAEQDLEERVLHDDDHRVGNNRIAVIVGRELHEVAQYRSEAVTGRLDEEMNYADLAGGGLGMDVYAGTSLFVQSGVSTTLLKANETIKIACDEVTMSSKSAPFAVVGKGALMVIAGPAEAGAKVPAGGEAGFVVLQSPMTDINPGVPPPGDRPLTDAETDADRQWEKDERAYYEGKTVRELEDDLRVRHWQGRWDMDDHENRSMWDRLMPWNLTDAAQKREDTWKRQAVDRLVSQSAAEREKRLNRPISADVKNRYPKEKLRNPGSYMRGLRKGEQDAKR